MSHLRDLLPGKGVPLVDRPDAVPRQRSAHEFVREIYRVWLPRSCHQALLAALNEHAVSVRSLDFGCVIEPESELERERERELVRHCVGSYDLVLLRVL